MDPAAVEGTTAARPPHHPSNDQLQAAAQARPYRDVPVPELGPGWVIRVAMLTGSQMLAWEAVRKDLPREEIAGHFIARTAIHPDGSRRFTDADAAWINASGWAWVSRVLAATNEVNGLTDEALAVAVKN